MVLAVGLLVAAVVGVFVHPRRAGWRKRANLEDHIRLVNELAVLIEAGVSLNEAIDVTSRSSVYRIFGDALSNLGRDLRRGINVPTAVRNNITTFPLYVYQLVDAGNHTGMIISPYPARAGAHPPREAVGHDWRRRAGCPS